MIYLEDLGSRPLPTSTPWPGAFQAATQQPNTHPRHGVDVYQADEQILENLSVRWCSWDRSVIFSFVSIKNAPGNARHLSLYAQYTRIWLEKRFKNPAPEGVDVYRERRFVYSEVGATNGA